MNQVLQIHACLAMLRGKARDLYRLTDTNWGLMACIALAVMVLGATGCGLPVANPNDSKANDPSHIRLRAGSILAPIEYESTKNVEAEAEYHPETKAFKVKVNTDAATVNETLVAMQREITQQYKDYKDQLQLVLENNKSIHATLQVLSANATQMVGMVTNLPGMIISALTGKPFTPNSPPALAQQAPAIDEPTLRRILREELKQALNSPAP